MNTFLDTLETALAIFFIWETILSVVPWTIPPWLQPGLVYGASLAYAWPDWRVALAASGLVGLLHFALVVQRESASPATKGNPQVIQRPGRAPRVPNLP